MKEGEPDLSPAAAERSIRAFSAAHPAGECKLFGGEPLLNPAAVRAAIEAAPPGLDVYLSTNGRGLDAAWLAYLHAQPRVTLTISMDGARRDHDGLRRGAPTYDDLVAKLPGILSLPRVVVTQVIAPSTASRALDNFLHLRSLGIRRFNLLPAYYVPWRPEQLEALSRSFGEIASHFESTWRAGDYLYLRNLFTLAPTPFYNTGMVVDSDERVYASNLILAGNFDALRAESALGTLDALPSAEALAAGAERAARRLRESTRPDIWASTLAADAALSRLCERLYAPYLEWRARGRGAEVAA